MELLRLDSNYQPDALIENFGSLIWTERYSKNGDFQITTNEVERFLNLLPLETPITLRESTVPMLVEIHKIEKPKNQAATLTIIGRSFETVLERRVSVETLDLDSARPPWMISAKKEADAAYLAMRTVLGDVDQTSEDPSLTALSAANTGDEIPDISLTVPLDFNTGDTTTPYEIKAQNLYTTVMELLAVNRRGLKAVRPDLNGTQVGIEIYNGADLTSEVVFDARFDQFDSAKYLLAKQGSTNVAYVYGINGASVVNKTTTVPTGLARRVLAVDALNEENVIDADVRNSRGLVELYKYNQTALFDGEISVQIAAGYNSQYFLGDIVKLVGEYGLEENVRVAEFIRVSDNTGEKAYPAFETIDS